MWGAPANFTRHLFPIGQVPRHGRVLICRKWLSARSRAGFRLASRARVLAPLRAPPAAAPNPAGFQRKHCFMEASQWPVPSGTLLC